ncbi:MAG: ribosome biogenesis GTPase YqeH [Anaeroplasmataceae bacterium]|nr:ribosome biogenesis GTPase YqeH [Anaeroplasmataceae bacterium]MDE6414045.1 ribosome biogenesis GTPase YqeH [Anaeroplasmataceae bacterium]
MSRKCVGCGAILQTQDETKPGFVPSISEEMKICKRCFRMMHYNELPKIVASNKEYEQVIDDVVKKKALMIFIVDIFSFKSTFHPMMIERLKNKDVILVANKLDLLPKSSNLSKVVEWISRECQRVKFNPLAIGIASAKNGAFMDDLVSTIDLARKERDVYFVGVANVGKSSIINALLKRTTSLTTDVIATSLIPGTTLNSIRIPYFEDNCALVDTPGLINEQDTLNKLLPISYKAIIPNHELKPVTYQITDQNSICLGGLAILSFTASKMVSVTVYASKSLYLHRCKTANLKELLHKQLGELLTPPTKEEIGKLEYAKTTFQINGKKDIWFAGFGFVQISGIAKVDVQYIKNTEVYLTNAILG